MDAAERLFLKKGVAATSIDDITAGALTGVPSCRCATSPPREGARPSDGRAGALRPS
nr:TetR family transcriptional regulator [Pigmentiphaga sp. NML080357]